MLRETKWLVGALAAALWVMPAAAQTSSQSGQAGTASGSATGKNAQGANETTGTTGSSSSMGTSSGTAESGTGTSGTAPSGSTSATGKNAQGANETTGTTGSSSSMGTSSGTAESGATGAQGTTGTATSEPGTNAMHHAAGQHARGDWAHTLAKLHAGNQAEIQAGTWMHEHATNDKVKDFAKKMVDDHGKMDKDLTSFAEKHQMELTSAPGAESKDTASLESLKTMQGAQADRAYMKMMVEDHTKDVKETKSAAQQAKSMKNNDLAKLLDKSAKKMEDHLKDAQKIQRDLTQRQARTPSAQ